MFYFEEELPRLAAEAILHGGESVLTVSKLRDAIESVDGSANVLGFYDHTKASERYVVIQVGGRTWCVPYYYRRTQLFIDSDEELVEYLAQVIPLLNDGGITKFKNLVKPCVDEIFGQGSTVTRPIFSLLLDKCGEWICNQDLNNPNSQRRIQDIKECGFTVSTKIIGRKTYHMLLPFPMVKAPTYETIPPLVRRKIFKLLEGVNAFTGCPCGISALPDHKFPEIRWTEDTAVANETLSDEELRSKFQLVPEFINQAKREVCRKCFQSDKRGVFSGIDFFYAGGPLWPTGIPKVGREAERGCVGCFWYDMQKWRDELNKILRGLKE